MTFYTVTFNGTEKPFGDLGMTGPRLERLNQGADTFGFNLANLAADAVDPFPYGAFITVQIGRNAPATAFYANGAPKPGNTQFSGGKVIFAGYRIETTATATAAMEMLSYKFTGPWEFFLNRTTFAKLHLTWNGVKQIAVPRTDITLGMSLTALTGAGDTVTGSTTTNLMSAAQQVKEIMAWGVLQSANLASKSPGLGWIAGAQFQSDPLTSDASGNYFLLPALLAQNFIQLPDFVPNHAGNANDTSANTTGLILRPPLDTANNIMCADGIKRMLKWLGPLRTPVGYFDYTQHPPAFRCVQADLLNVVNLPFTKGNVRTRIKRRDDLIPLAISLQYRQSGTINGSPYEQTVTDITAPLNGGPMQEAVGIFLGPQYDGHFPPVTQNFADYMTLPSVQTASFDFQGTSTFQASAVVSCQPIVGAGVGINAPATDPFWSGLFPELASARPGTLSFSPSALAPQLTINGVAVDTTQFGFRFLDGVVAPWMETQANIQAQVVEANLTAYFDYTEQSTPGVGTPVIKGVISKKQCNVAIKVTNLAGGTYLSTPSAIAGEVIPIGLSGWLYANESVPQYEGSFVLQEMEITDACPLGSALNITGSANQAWSTMKAIVQSVYYDFEIAQTTINFGPGEHLGPADLVRRLQTNHGPRWINLIGNNPLNSAGATGATALGQNVPKQSASPGTVTSQTQSFPSNVGDAETNPYANGAFPGVHHDATPGGQANQPAPSVAPIGQSQGQAITIVSSAMGTGAPVAGQVGNFIRLSLADAQGCLAALQAANPGFSAGLFKLMLRIVPACQNGAQGFYIMPSSIFYPLSNPPAADPNHTLMP